MNENKSKSSSGLIGRIAGAICAACLGICISAIAIIASIKFIIWLWLI